MTTNNIEKVEKAVEKIEEQKKEYNDLITALNVETDSLEQIQNSLIFKLKKRKNKGYDDMNKKIIEEYYYINRKIEDNRMLLEDLESDI